MRKKFRFLAVLLICAMLLPNAVAMAADTETADAATTEQSLASATDEKSIINGTQLTQWVEQYMEANNISSDQISVGYCYTGTGDSWYYNGDKWFYPASMYKVPLIMLLSEKVKAGELSQDSMIYDKDVASIESYILTYSNNDWAHIIRKYLGGDDVWREDAKKYAQLTDADYDSDYLDYCYFSNRYMTQVMTTLYSQSDNFPNVVDCLLVAEEGEYYKINLGDQYKIAQKYGSYTDSRGEEFNHCTAIVYTPNPCIITVMTSNVKKYEAAISDIGDMLVEYTLTLDGQLDSHKEKLAAMAEEEERQAAEAQAEAERQAQEQAEQAAAAKAEAEAQAKKDAQSAQRKVILDKMLKVVKILVVVAVVLLLLRFCVKVYKQVQSKENQQLPRARRGGRNGQKLGGFDEADGDSKEDDFKNPFIDDDDEEQPEQEDYSSGHQAATVETETVERDEAEAEDNYQEQASYKLPRAQRRVRQEDYDLMDSGESRATKTVYRSKRAPGSKYTPKH
jgi:hypothetical protein